MGPTTLDLERGRRAYSELSQRNPYYPLAAPLGHGCCSNNFNAECSPKHVECYHSLLDVDPSWTFTKGAVASWLFRGFKKT